MMHFDLIPSTLSPLDLFLLLLNTFFPTSPSPHFHIFCVTPAFH